MPGLDGTGPMGQGTGTGRGLGKCNPANDTKINEDIKRPIGGAFRRGCGRGLGRNGTSAPINDNKGQE